jgi:hypothetical protein
LAASVMELISGLPGMASYWPVRVLDRATVSACVVKVPPSAQVR